MSRRRSTAAMAADMDDETTDLIHALQAQGNFALAADLWSCAMNRIERIEDQRAGLPVGWADRCRSPACPSCRRWLGATWRRQAADLFTGAANEDCSMLTVMLAAAADLEHVPGLIAKLRSSLRNLRDRKAAAARRWGRVAVVGYVECDAVAVEDLDKLPDQRREMAEALPRIGLGDVLWIPHLHASVHHPGVSRDEFRRAVEAVWPGPFRTNVKPFGRTASAATNAGNVASYSIKAEMLNRFVATLLGAHGREYRDIVEEPWPLSRRAEYWSWLDRAGDGLRPLRVRLAPRGLRRRDPHEVADEVPVEPMPVGFVGSSCGFLVGESMGRGMGNSVSVKLSPDGSKAGSRDASARTAAEFSSKTMLRKSGPKIEGEDMAPVEGRVGRVPGGGIGRFPGDEPTIEGAAEDDQGDDRGRVAGQTGRDRGTRRGHGPHTFRRPAATL